MDKYKFIEHTADFEFQAFGKTLEEAFANAALAVTDVVVEQSEVEVTQTKSIFIQADDLKSLLYDFLEKVLNLMETDYFVIAEVASVKIQKGNKYVLSAELRGDKGLEKYEYKRAVKSVTYSDMIIDQKPDAVMLQVVLDI
jgi:SHS2 domain-containing protein